MAVRHQAPVVVFGLLPARLMAVAVIGLLVDRVTGPEIGGEADRGLTSCAKRYGGVMAVVEATSHAAEEAPGALLDHRRLPKAEQLSPPCSVQCAQYSSQSTWARKPREGAPDLRIAARSAKSARRSASRVVAAITTNNRRTAGRDRRRRSSRLRACAPCPLAGPRRPRHRPRPCRSRRAWRG